MMASLRNMVAEVAEKVKEVEDKIESSYLKLRKAVLSQVEVYDIVVDSFNEIAIVV